MHIINEAVRLRRRATRSALLWIGVMWFAALSLNTSKAVVSQDEPAPRPASVTVHLDRTLGTIDPLIYGHFTEETLTSWEGGVSSEMLVDRKFSVPEARNLNPPILKSLLAGDHAAENCPFLSRFRSWS